MLERLITGCSDDAFDSGIVIDANLEPLAGEGSPIKPPTYIGGVFQLGKRWASPDDEHPTDIVVIDNVASQANRIEAALRQQAAALGLPEILLDLSGIENLPPHLPGQISSWQFPHRVADAYLRDSLLEGQDFMKSELGRSLFAATPWAAGPLMGWFPQALLFGFWQSHLGKKAAQTKSARAWSSEIIGWAPADVTSRLAGTKGDPLNLTSDVEVTSLVDDRRLWEVGVAAIKGAKKDRLSEIGHGQVPFAGSESALAGVSFRSITQRTIVSFAELRKLSLGTGNGRADAAMRALLVAVGLHGHSLAFGRGMALRSGADLRTTRHSARWLGSTADEAIDLAAPTTQWAWSPRQPRTHVLPGSLSTGVCGAGSPSAQREPGEGDSSDVAGALLMLVISAELLMGTIRADPDGAAVTGKATEAEWPPSPMWLFSALVAADGTGERCRVTSGEELVALEEARPPMIYAAGPPDVVHHVLEERFVVEAGVHQSGTHQEYVGKKGALVRPGVRAAVRWPTVWYLWPDMETRWADAIARRCARVGYLGTSDSPVRLRVHDKVGDVATLVRLDPDPSGDTYIRVPRSGTIAVLDAAFEAWQRRGPSVSRAQFPAIDHRVAYSNGAERAVSPIGEIAAWLMLDRPVTGRAVSRLTDLFKKAVLASHQQLFGEPPPELHGHGSDPTDITSPAIWRSPTPASVTDRTDPWSCSVGTRSLIRLRASRPVTPPTDCRICMDMASPWASLL
ncbi:MAG: type I-U CRISPR-associated protein Csb2 [Ilumatobacteraceae bacterium]